MVQLMFFSTQGPGDLFFISWTPDPNSNSFSSDVEDGFQCLAEWIQSRNAVLLHERIYGQAAFSDAVLKARNQVFTEKGLQSGILPTYVEGSPLDGRKIAGLHAIAISGGLADESPLLEWNGRVCGRTVRGRDAQYLALSDVGRLVRQVGQEPPEEETRKTFEAVESVLNQVNWKFNEVRRTWFYLHNILDWYHEFNQVRNSAFKRLGLFNGNPLSSIPASTGIQGRNADGGWCTLDLLAMRALDGCTFETKRLVNPKQNEAPEYGSAFARALSVKTDRCRYIFVSGTASIDEHGVSVHPGDFEKQTVRTLENVEALLGTAGAGLGDICQATSFVKRPEDVERYRAIAGRMGLDKIPVVCTLADVCRPELLYELDATAVLPVL